MTDIRDLVNDDLKTSFDYDTIESAELVKKATKLLEDGYLEAAIKGFENALELDSNNFEAKAGLREGNRKNNYNKGVEKQHYGCLVEAINFYLKAYELGLKEIKEVDHWQISNFDNKEEILDYAEMLQDMLREKPYAYSSNDYMEYDSMVNKSKEVNFNIDDIKTLILEIIKNDDYPDSTDLGMLVSAMLNLRLGVNDTFKLDLNNYKEVVRKDGKTYTWKGDNLGYYHERGNLRIDNAVFTGSIGEWMKGGRIDINSDIAKEIDAGNCMKEGEIFFHGTRHDNTHIKAGHMMSGGKIVFFRESITKGYQEKKDSDWNSDYVGIDMEGGEIKMIGSMSNFRLGDNMRGGKIIINGESLGNFDYAVIGHNMNDGKIIMKDHYGGGIVRVANEMSGGHIEIYRLDRFNPYDFSGGRLEIGSLSRWAECILPKGWNSSITGGEIYIDGIQACPISDIYKFRRYILRHWREKKQR